MRRFLGRFLTAALVVVCGGAIAAAQTGLEQCGDPVQGAVPPPNSSLLDRLSRVPQDAYRPTSTPSVPVAVDQCGNPDNLCVEGTHAFTGKQVVAALLWDFDVLVAAHPAAPLGVYLGVLRCKTTAGYRNAGFPNVAVSAHLEIASRRVILRVVEGPRYLAGEVRVRGQRTVPLRELIRG